MLDNLAEALVHLSAHSLKPHVDFDAEQVDVVFHSREILFHSREILFHFSKALVYFGFEPRFHAVQRISGHRSYISRVHAFSLHDPAGV